LEYFAFNHCVKATWEYSVDGRSLTVSERRVRINIKERLKEADDSRKRIAVEKDLGNFSHATIFITPYLAGVSNYIWANSHNSTTRKKFGKSLKNASKNCDGSYFLIYMST
jgi:hypothetical protein